MTPSPKGPPDRRPFFNRPWFQGLGLLVLVVLVYLPALRGEFLWDDNSWTSDLAPLLGDFAGLMRMWTDVTALQQYFPLTGTTFWLDHQLWGSWTMPYHLENVLLHAAGAILFWRLLLRLQLPGAWLAAALFALHPVHVESVAWITERKNVLCLVLYLSSLHAYGRFQRWWDPAAVPGAPGRGAYSVAFLLFVAAYLAKATAFSFPAVLLVIAWWKRGRIRWRADVLPALPFFALAIGLGLVVYWIEREQLGAKGAAWDLPFTERCLVAGRVLWFYVGKLVWPANLCFLYPRWELDAGSLGQWFYPLAAGGVMVGVWLGRKRIGRGPAAAVFFYAGTLFPLLGFLNVYFMEYSFVSDHWVYLPSLGLFALGAALVARGADAIRFPELQTGCALLLLPVLAVLSWKQTRVYQSSDALWTHTLATNPKAWVAHHNRAMQLQARGQLAEAAEHYHTVLELHPNDERARNNLGVVLAALGQLPEAIGHYERALEMRPDFADAHNNLAAAHYRSGNLGPAEAHQRWAVALDPQSAGKWSNLGDILKVAGKPEEAAGAYQSSVRLAPGDVGSQERWAGALLAAGKPEEAITIYEEVLRRASNRAGLHIDLGNAHATRNDFDAAILSYRRALQLQPTNAFVFYNLGLVLQQQGRKPEATTNLLEAVRLNPKLMEPAMRLILDSAAKSE